MDETVKSIWDSALAANRWWSSLWKDEKLYWVNRFLELNTIDITDKQIIRLHHKWLKLQKTN